MILGGRRFNRGAKALEDLVRWLLDHTPVRVLVLAARLVAPVPTLDPVPGWTFNEGEASRSLRDRLRRGIWRVCTRRRIDVPIPMRWGSLRFQLHIGSDLGWCLFVGGAFEPNSLALLMRTLAPGMTFVDAGANEGLYTLIASQRVGPSGTVIAIEPSSRELERLQSNLRTNQIDNVTVVPRALGADISRKELHVADDRHSGLNTLGKFAGTGAMETRTEMVEVLPLDNVLKERGVRDPDVVKLDIEGAEYSALLGAKAALATYPLLLIELNNLALGDQGASAQQVVSFLKRRGYMILTFNESTGTPEPTQTGSSSSSNIVAVHPDRPFALLAEEPGLRSAL
jgi:FkbM family methyltransferase